MSEIPPKKSVHGGSPGSGLVLPAGLERLQPSVPEGMVLVPQEVVDAREQAKKREARALQLERRRIAVEVLPGLIAGQAAQANLTAWAVSAESLATNALNIADELIKQTGGGI